MQRVAVRANYVNKLSYGFSGCGSLALALALVMVMDNGAFVYELLNISIDHRIG